MSKEIKSTYLVRLSGEKCLPMMFRNDCAGRTEAIDYAYDLLKALPFDTAEIWHFDPMGIVATINKRENPDLK